jgi:hypothetical protein
VTGPRLLEREANHRLVERLDVKRALGATDRELTAGEAIDIDSGGADRRRCPRVFKHGEHVVGELVGLRRRVSGESSDAIRLPKHADREIDQVAPEFEHRPARIAGEFTTRCRIEHLPHDRVDLTSSHGKIYSSQNLDATSSGAQALNN